MQVRRGAAQIVTLRRVIAYSAIAVVAMWYAGASLVSAQTSTAPPPVIPQAVPIVITGAGSTFSGPLYSDWASEFGVAKVGYTSSSSAAGITGLQQNLVDFAADDAPLGPADIAGAKGPVLQFPVMLGGISIAYQLPGIGSGLRLDGPTLANIFLGNVTMWNDPAIKKLNPKLALPAQAIIVVHRADAAGTTATLTEYLSATSPLWAATPGEGISQTPNWPAHSLAAAGNLGVTTDMRHTVYSITYVEQDLALYNGLTVAAIKNADGTFALPSLASTTIAGEGLAPPANLGFGVVNASKNPKAYPITSAGYIDTYTDMCKVGVPGGEASAAAVKQFLNYDLTTGQGDASVYFYASLPKSLDSLAIKQLSQLQCNGAPLG